MTLMDSCFSLEYRIPADFHSQLLFGHRFLALVVWAVEHSMGLRLLLRGNFGS